MKRIIFIMVFGIVLLLGIVIATDIDKIKIDKIKLEDGTTEYRIYRLSEVTTDEKIDKTKDKLEKEKEVILDSFYEECVEGCPIFCNAITDINISVEMITEKEKLERYNDCIETCPSQCEQQELISLQMIDYELNELEKIRK